MDSKLIPEVWNEQQLLQRREKLRENILISLVAVSSPCSESIIKKETTKNFDNNWSIKNSMNNKITDRPCCSLILQNW